MPLREQRLGEVVRPASLCAIDLNQGVANGAVRRLRLAPLDEVVEVRQALIDSFLVTGIAAEQEIVQTQAVVHDLAANALDRAEALESAGRTGDREPFLEADAHAHDEQHAKRAQDPAKSYVQFPAYRHVNSSASAHNSSLDAPKRSDPLR